MFLSEIYNQISDDGKNVLNPYLMDQSARNDQGQTLLMALTNPSIYTNDNENVLRFVREVISDPHTDMNAQDNDGNTALMHLSKNMFGEAYIDSINKIHKSWVGRYADAIRSGNFNKYNPNIINNHGETALMVACRNGDIDTAQELVKDDRFSGVNVDIRNNEGDTALMVLLRSLDKFSDERGAIYPISRSNYFLDERLGKLLSKLYERTSARINNKGQTGLMGILDYIDLGYNRFDYSELRGTLMRSCESFDSNYFEAQDNDGNGVLFYIFRKNFMNKEYMHSFLRDMLFQLLNRHDPSRMKIGFYPSNKYGFRPVISIFLNPTKDNNNSFGFLEELRSCGKYGNYWFDELFDQKTYDECIRLLVGFKDKFEVGSKDFVTVTTNCLYLLLMCRMKGNSMEDVIKQIKDAGFDYKFDLQTAYDLDFDCIPLLLSSGLISMEEMDQIKDVRQHNMASRMDTLLKLLGANLLSDNAKQQILLKCFLEIPENAIQMIETILQSGTEFPVKLDGVYFPVHDAIRLKLVFRIGESFMKDFFHSKTCQPYFAGLLYSIYKVSGDHFDPVEPCVSLERDYTYQNSRTYRSLNNGGCFQVSCFGFGYDRTSGIRRTDQIAEFMRNIPQNSLNNDLIVSYVGWLLVNYNYEFAEVMLPYMPDTFHYEYNENDVEKLLWGVLFDELGYDPSPLRHYTACERFQIVYSFLSKTDSFCKNFDLKSLDRILDRSDSKNSENWFYKIIHSLDHIKSIDNNPLDGQEQSLDKRERILIEKLSCVLMLINTIDQDGKKPMNELLNCIILKENNMNKLFKLMVCLSLNPDESGVSFRSQQPFEKRQYQALKDFYQQGDKFKIAPWQRTRLSCWEMPFLKLDGSMILKIYDQVREDVKAESKLPKHRESPKIESSHRTTVEFDIKDRVSQQKTDGSGSDKKISPSRGDGIGDADL